MSCAVREKQKTEREQQGRRGWRLAGGSLLAVAMLMPGAAFGFQIMDTAFARYDGPAGAPCDSKEGLPRDRTPKHLIGAVDPIEWKVIGRGERATVYRRATQEEMRKNRWKPGTFLVAAPGLYDGTRGARQVKLVVPLADDRVQEVNFALTAKVNDLEFIERIVIPNSPNGEVQSKTLKPTLFEYMNQGYDPRRPRPVKGAWATMVAGTDGGFFATGLADGFEFEAGGPGGWSVEEMPAPGGVAPNPKNVVPVRVMDLGTFGTTQYNNCNGNFVSPACNWFCTEMVGVPCTNNPHLDPPPAKHCVDTLDNDGDVTKDNGDNECKPQPAYGDDLHPGFPVRDWESGKSFALFGEGRYCTNYATAEYDEDGKVVGFGNWIHRLTAMGWKTEALMNASLPWTGLTGREKQMRYRAGGCWVFPSLAEAAACNANGTGCPNGYPYNNSGANSANYYGRVWDDVHHAMFVGLKDALHYAQVVHYGGSDVLLSCSAGEAVCCGASLNLFASNAGRGSSVVQYEYTAGAAQCSIASAPVVSAHEFGHSSGLDHNDTQNYMHTPAFDSPALPVADKNLLLGCLSTWDCPRPSGFRWVAP